jgi:drug/metabolite transporter (DMT)-like permease
MVESGPDALAARAPAGQRYARALPYALLAMCTLFWAGNWVVGRGVHEIVPPVGLNFWRWFVAVVLLTPFAWSGMRGNWHVVARRWRYFFILGLTGAALFQTLVYAGLQFTTAINGMLLNSTAPISMICISWIMLGERVSRRQWFGVTISFLGALAIITKGDPRLLLGLSFNPGDLIIAVAMPLWSLYSVLLRRRPAELGGVPLLWIISLFAMVPLSLLYLGENLMGRHVRFDAQAISVFLYVGIFASILAMLFWNKAVSMVGPNVSGFFLHLLPVFGTVLAVIFLGETIRGFQIAGVGLIFVGIFFSASARARPAARQAD